MSENEDVAPAGPGETLIPIVVALPAALLAHHEDEVAQGLSASLEEGLRAVILDGYRYHRGRYSTLWIDLRRPDEQPDTDQPSDEEVLAAADAFADAAKGDKAAGEDPEQP